MSTSVTDVKKAAQEVVYQRDRRFQATLETPQREADPDRPNQNVYRIATHGHPANLPGQVLHKLGLPLPPYKRNEDRFSKAFHPAYDQLTDAAESELQRLWDGESDGLTWVEIVER